ncbi:MAG TPA: alanine--glyoxylate aminotransferase family protein, partial [Firmicutes bacterium]|nr:alanine--glyoxylate aminotransferase family protein [Bacillota bacterium]
MKKRYIMAPGPTEIPAEVLAEGGKPILHHRTPQFRKILTQVEEDLKYLMQTKETVQVLTSSGTGAMETAVANTVNPKDKVIVASIGHFGNRWASIAKIYGAEVIKIEAEWGNAMDPAEVKKALEENKDAVAVFTTHNETSTGVYNDIEAIGKIVKEYDAILVVDGISGIGALPFYTDKWNVDMAVAGSQKGMMIPPGIATITVSPKAWKVVENNKQPKFYFDLKKYEKSMTEEKLGNTPYTPAASLVMQLGAALNIIKEETIEKVWERHEKLAEATRAGVKALGLTLFAKENASNVLTSVYVPEGVDGGALMKKIRDDYGISMAGGQGPVTGKIFRIGHLGYTDRFDPVIGIAAS